MQNMKNSNPDLPTTEIAKKLGEMWQKMSSNILGHSPLYLLWVVMPLLFHPWGIFCNVFCYVYSYKDIICVLMVSSFLVMSRRREAALYSAGPGWQETLWKGIRCLSWWGTSWCGFRQWVWLESHSCAWDVGGNRWLLVQFVTWNYLSWSDSGHWLKLEWYICKQQLALLPSDEIAVPCVRRWALLSIARCFLQRTYAVQILYGYILVSFV